MKSEKKILFAFILNLAFSLFEFFGGVFSGSVAIMSDAVHDTGDALSIGVSYFLEKKSKKQPDASHTYGYARYSVLGGVITTLVLLVGSVFVIYNAIMRIINPRPIDYNSMLIFAVIGTAVNLGAAVLTHGGDSLNQRAVSLHMLEDVLGWVLVLLGALLMKFTNFSLIDPLLSIGVAVFIIVNALSHLKEILDLFLEKAPRGISIATLEEHLLTLDGVLGVHHIHIWSLDGRQTFATLHIVTNEPTKELKDSIRAELCEHGISHATLELEREDEECNAVHCHIEDTPSHHHHHHHHH